ncbi:SusC/RagA family TonB-linked outer membrane protein [Flagellimonas onchidii]|uniref:SusC/RagA family TonB-linked outer membrane protein n=1 Tax=Flagellimonas onchidii TaxID=2562684 RepID=UPI0010A69A72|nr:SusC/RagA family TonB-linked outer membrane protein [Allomuricauda onchidii]
MKRLLIMIALLGTSLFVKAQITMTGNVMEQNTNVPLLGVTIVVKNTQNGTSTDFDGNYSIVANLNDILVFSYVGYKTKEVTILNQNPITVFMEPDLVQMKEVVVSALNIERDKESLGYSISQVQADQVNVARENNVMNSLSGKVSGLQITQSNTGVDGSSRVLLRGVTTINGSNRPLVVIDGIPINNGFGGAGSSGGIDSGDALADINPDDVESISVLKGAGAAAAYGSLGINGVILITTKTGTQKKGIGISVNSTFTLTDVFLTPDLQNEYGTGAFDQFAPINADGRPVLDYPFSWSWGPRMEGQSYTNWLGQTDAYLPQGNPYKQFYSTGHNMANTVAFEGASEKGSFRIAVTNESAQGIISNNTLSKQTINIRGTSKLTKDLSIDGKVTYINAKVRNRPSLAEGSANTTLQLSLMPRDIRLEDVRNNTINANGEEIKWNLDNTFNNPYWAKNNVKNTDVRDRFQGHLGLNWKATPKINVTAKTGLDYQTYDNVSHAPRGAQAIANGLGQYSHGSGNFGIWNSDILATYTPRAKNLDLSFSLGSNYRSEFGKDINVWGNSSKVPEFYNISNYLNTFSRESRSEKDIYSFYGLAQLGYGGMIYFDATLRNDNSSALPKDNDSYWYHSENLSVLFSRILGIEGNVLNIGKLRGSFARVGNDTAPYRTQAVYTIDQTVTLPYTVASIPSSLPNFDLRPEISESWEVGAELGFFNNRITLDATYYQTSTKDQIMAVPISGASGFSSKVVNAGEIQNKGVEVLLGLVPFDSDSFSWNLSANFTKSNSKVVSLNEGLESIVLNNLQGVSVEARPGEEFGTLYGNDFLRDNFGRKLITNEGLAQKGERIKMGSINPDWYGGISNSFRYKNLTLNALVSVQKGGEFYSYGRAYRMFFGTDARSLEGRETGIVEDGINENTGFVNETATTAMLKQFTDIFSNQIAVNQILDATNVRLKEVTLTYNFPKKHLRGTPLQSVSISAVGRNLLFFYNAAEDIDPESGYSSGSTGTAFEHSSLPSTRSMGLNLKVNF